MDINQADYPFLFGEHTWPWGPVKTVFEPGEPPHELLSNVNIAPFDDTGWLIIRQQIGWGIVGGTLEPGETYLDTLKRELIEEACRLLERRPDDGPLLAEIYRFAATVRDRLC